MTRRIKLGDTVEDKYTGMKGVVTGKTQFVNGCIQFLVARKIEKGINPEGVEIGVDERSLKIIKKRNENEYKYLDEMERESEYKPKEPKLQPKPKKKKESNGGPMTVGTKMRGY